MTEPTEQNTTIEDKKQHLKEMLYGIVDEMVDTLETLNVDTYIQFHMFANDFVPPVGSPLQGILLHDVFCEINTDLLIKSDIKHQIGLDQLLNRSRYIYNMSTPIGKLMIDSLERMDPGSNSIVKLETELDESLENRDSVQFIRIEEDTLHTTPRLRSTGVIALPRDYIVNDQTLSHLMQSARNLFNDNAATQVDRLIGAHNAEITRLRAVVDTDEEEGITEGPPEPQDVILRIARQGQHSLSSYGTLFLQPTVSVDHLDLSEMLSIAESHNINEQQVRDCVMIHNQSLLEPDYSREDPIRIDNGAILPENTGFINIYIRMQIIESGNRLAPGQGRRAARIIDEHNYRLLRRQRQDQQERTLNQRDTFNHHIDEIDRIIRQTNDEEDQQEQVLQVPEEVETIYPVSDDTIINDRLDEPGDVAQDVNRPRARPIFPGDPRYTPIPGRDPVDEVVEIPQNTEPDIIQVNNRLISIHNRQIIPHDIGHINDEDRDFLIENAWRLDVDAITLRSIIDNHNNTILARIRDERIMSGEESIEGPVEVFASHIRDEPDAYRIEDTGFSGENIRPLITDAERDNITIEEEGDDIGEERPDGG